MFYVCLITTKQKPIADVQKIKRKDSKYNTTENYITKEETKRERKKQRNYRTDRKQ